MPGHTASIASSHPESIACHEASPWSSFAAEPPAGQLRLDNSTLKVSRSLVESVLSLLKGRLFSTGGDEIVRLLPPFLFCFLQPYLAPPSSSINGCCFAQNEHCYLSDPATAVTINETSGGLDTLLSTFVNRLHSSVRKAGKTPVVWEEMVLGHSLELETDTAVLSWINSVRLSLLLSFPASSDSYSSLPLRPSLTRRITPPPSPNKATALFTHRTSCLSSSRSALIFRHRRSDYFYLDCGIGSWLGDTPDHNSWCSFVSWQKVRPLFFPPLTFLR
jgi:hexosaminidase